jgi:hypothetical protein
VNVFHAGDGNLHPMILFDTRDAGETARVQAAGDEIIRACVEAGGTITGEHGIGIEKRHLMPLVFSEADLAAMARVKRAFDPEGFSTSRSSPAPRGDVAPRRPPAPRANELQRLADLLVRPPGAGTPPLSRLTASPRAVVEPRNAYETARALASRPTSAWGRHLGRHGGGRNPLAPGYPRRARSTR